MIIAIPIYVLFTRENPETKKRNDDIIKKHQEKIKDENNR
jgi:hypothetical protein